MKRSFCFLSTFLRAKDIAMLADGEKRYLITNFKDWRFNYPPTYANLPIKEHLDCTERVAVNNAIFSKVFNFT